MSLRVAIIGTGHGARHHIAAAAENPALQIHLIAGREPARARALAAEHCPGATPASIEEALREPSIDAVMIAVTPVAQPEIAVKAFENGKHVLCEKPLGATVADAVRIQAAWQAAGTVGMVNFCYRFIPEIAAFGEHLRAQRCGALSLVQAEWVLSSRLDQRLPPNWKTKRAQGGGVLQNYGSHVIDYLFHDALDVDVRAAHLRASGPGTAEDNEDTATVFFETAGVAAVMHLSLVTRPALGHRIVARGTEGTLQVRNPHVSSPAGPFELKWAPADVATSHVQQDASSGGQYDLARLFRRVHVRFAQAIAENASAYSPNIASGVRVARIIAEICEVARPARPSRAH